MPSLKSGIRRPPNCWIIYRSDAMKRLPPLKPGDPERTQADVSRMLAKQWKEETPEVREEYQRRADIKSAEHRQLYPDYIFQPVKKADKIRLRAERRQIRAMSTKSRKNATRVASSLPPSEASSGSQMPHYQSHQVAAGSWQRIGAPSTTCSTGDRASSTSRSLLELQCTMLSAPATHNQLTQAASPGWQAEQPQDPRLTPSIFTHSQTLNLPFGSIRKVGPLGDCPTGFDGQSSQLSLFNRQPAIATQANLTRTFEPPKQATPSASLSQARGRLMCRNTPDITGWNSRPTQTEQNFTSHPVMLEPSSTIPQMDPFQQSFEWKVDGSSWIASKLRSGDHEGMISQPQREGNPTTFISGATNNQTWEFCDWVDFGL